MKKCKFKKQLNDANFCRVACYYCTYEQEATCKRKEFEEDEKPTEDLVAVVRCKDCKHSYFVKSCSKYECRKGCGTLKYSTDYCSYGERREE